jgi:lipid-binding SYLF domain-containing protein
MNSLRMFFVAVFVSAAMIGCKETKKGMENDIDNAVEVAGEAAEDVVDATEAAGEVVDQVVDSVAVIAKDLNAAVAAPVFNASFPKDATLASEVNSGLQTMVNEHPAMAKHFKSAYAYAYFPKITKGGLGVGGAGGKGLVVEQGSVIGSSSLMQATIGLQAGGQTYSELILFENKAALDRFTNEKFKLSAGASAVALKKGTGAEMAYQDGVSIFTRAIGGVMAEASVGTQKFKFHPK